MTDLITLSKTEINALLASPLTASQLKKTSKADLIAQFDAMNAADALDADMRDARADDTPPTDPSLAKDLQDLQDAYHDAAAHAVKDRLTDLEKRVLVAYLDAGIDCNGAETLDAMLDDNMTWGDAQEIAQRTGLKVKAVVGVISSLSQKGLLVITDEAVNGEGPVQQVLSDDGLRVAFNLLADDVTANPADSMDMAIVDHVKAHARKHYEKDGWDLVIETMTDAEIWAVVKGLSKAKAVSAMKAHNGPYEEQRRAHDAEAKAGGAEVVKLPTKKPATRSLDDRLITPAGKLEDVKAMTDGSKRHLLCQALLHGATVEHLEEVLGWNRDTVTSAMRWDMAQVGLGVERKGGKYYLIMPEGLKRLAVRTKDVTRAEALVAACR